MLVTRMTMAAATVIALSAAATAKPLTLPAETNLRAAPGTKSEIITLIPKGSAVEVGDCDAGWCKVKFGDKEGFAIARNVSEAPAPTAARPQKPASSQANLQKLRRGYEQYFDNGQNDVTGSVDDEPEQQYSQNTPPRYVPPKNVRRQYDRRVYDTEDFEDDDDVVAYVPSRPPVYYSYGPYPRYYYSPGPYYYRRW
jgi:hypothetical protein